MRPASGCDSGQCGWGLTCEWLYGRGLTRQERRTAVLLVRLQTNKEIALSLNRSVRTAEHHVEAVLAKLWVKRREVARMVCAQAGIRPQGDPACIRHWPQRPNWDGHLIGNGRPGGGGTREERDAYIE